MKRLVTILLLKLILLPVIWNGISLWHYVTEHTHTFCLADSAEHTHQNPENCISLCQIVNNQPHQPIPTTIDYYELKTCLTNNLFLNTQPPEYIKQDNFTTPPLLQHFFPNSIFRPPII